MSTAFTDRSFIYAECSGGSYQADGTYSEGSVSTRTVTGTVQPMSFKECLAFSDGSRNSGYVKIYCNEKLSARERGESSGGFVKYGGEIYRLTSAQAYQNGVMSHWKYAACLVPEKEIPQAIAEAFA